MLTRYRVGFTKTVPENILDLIDVRIIPTGEKAHTCDVCDTVLNFVEFTCNISYIMNTTRINVMYVINFY